MIRNEVDQRLHSVLMNTNEKRFEFVEASLRVAGVIRANIEVIFDGVRTSGDAFEQSRIIRRLADARIIGRGRLLQDSSEPDVGEAHLTDGIERGVVDVVKFAGTVFGQSAVRFARFVYVAEEPDEQLINWHSRSIGAETAAWENELFGGRSEMDLIIVRDIFISPARHAAFVRTSPDPAPAVVFSEVFRVNGEFDCAAELLQRQTKGESILLRKSAAR